jgi:hypothetical protein
MLHGKAFVCPGFEISTAVPEFACFMFLVNIKQIPALRRSDRSMQVLLVLESNVLLAKEYLDLQTF